MSSISVIRKMDKLGRVVIPIDFREKFNMKIDDNIEVFIYDDHIGIKKYEKSCVICGAKSDLFEVGDKNICHRCGRLIGGRVG